MATETTPCLRRRRFVALAFGTWAVLSLVHLARVAMLLGPESSSAEALFLSNYLSLIIGGAAYGLWRGVEWCWWVLFALCMVMIPPALNPNIGARVELGPLLGAIALWTVRGAVGERRALPEPSGAEQVRTVVSRAHVVFGLVSAPFVLWLYIPHEHPGVSIGMWLLLTAVALLLATLSIVGGLFLLKEKPIGIGVLLLWYSLCALYAGPNAPLVLGLGAWVMFLLWWSSPRRAVSAPPAAAVTG